MKKKILSILLISALIFAVVACSSTPQTILPTDYSKSENWSKCQYSGAKSADTFFIMGTVVVKAQENDDGTVDITDELRTNFDAACITSADVFSETTNMYVPYYRQMDFLSTIAVVGEGGISGFVDALHTSRAYLDITAALDYYFENYNKGKPVIIAGHSQGSAIIRSVLSDYMDQHPEYYKLMVAAYGIGMGFPESYFETYPKVKKVTGETDTGVVISWNTEAPGATIPNDLVSEGNCLCINPLNWKLDDTYAPATDNKGSLVEGKFVENFADARNDLTRHTLITNAPVAPLDPGFGDKSLHPYDFSLYYKNVGENSAKRIAAFLNK